MSKEKQIEEMTKHCPCYIAEKCCIDNESPERCDMICQFGTYAEALYNAGYRKQEWISVDEKLPKTFDTVLVYDTHTQSVRWATYWGKTDVWCGGRITHWMPLPEAPKMKGDTK